MQDDILIILRCCDLSRAFDFFFAAILRYLESFANFQTNIAIFVDQFLALTLHTTKKISNEAQNKESTNNLTKKTNTFGKISIH